MLMLHFSHFVPTFLPSPSRSACHTYKPNLISFHVEDLHSCLSVSSESSAFYEVPSK